jgi:hypothetical protein
MPPAAAVAGRQPAPLESAVVGLRVFAEFG